MKKYNNIKKFENYLNEPKNVENIINDLKQMSNKYRIIDGHYVILKMTLDKYIEDLENQ